MRKRYVQRKVNGEWVLVPCDATSLPGISIIRGNFENFRSPIDGTIISTQRQYDDHCRKHNVVPAQEFSPEYYERKAAERARIYTNERTARERREIKQDIYNTMTEAERG